MKEVEKLRETPNTVHGRLLEAVHISGYSFERACSELEWLLDEDRWTQIGGGFDDINTFLATIDLSEFRIAIEQRKKLAKRLKEIEASQRATAKMLGVDESTIRQDLGKRSAGNPAAALVEPAENSQSEIDIAGNPAPEWFQDDVDPAKLAKTQASRKRKESERQEQRNENAGQVAVAPTLGTLNGNFSTIVIDPPWAWEDEGDHEQLGRGRHTYSSMTFEELLEFPVGNVAGDDCHLYLWITNRSLPKGFALIDRWGFRYITCLTWCKPSFGMGNYFRGQTEHILFGVKGSLPLLRKDAGTRFEAGRPSKTHSAKPPEFFDLIETCSPAPRVELFARGLRPGWTVWGAEAVDAAD